jgi:hypothetical protein
MRGGRGENDEYKRSSSTDDGSRRLWSIFPFTKAPSKEQKHQTNISAIASRQPDTSRPDLIRLRTQVVAKTLDLKSKALGEIHGLLKNHDNEKIISSSASKLTVEEVKATAVSSRNSSLNLNLFPTRQHTVYLPFKLIDEKMILNTQHAQNEIIDNNIFVVGVIGRPGSGKTTVAHSIAGQSFSSISTRPHVHTIGLGFLYLIFQKLPYHP